MSLVCGIDYSTHAVDVVLLEEDSDRAEWRRFELTGQDAFDRAREVRDNFYTRSWWMDSPVLAVGIEEPRGYNAGALYRVQGAILACLPRQVLVQPWLPSEWRRRVGLPGNASKEAVGKWALDRWAGAPLHATFDVTDAYCIALATRDALQKEDAA